MKNKALTIIIVIFLFVGIIIDFEAYSLQTQLEWVDIIVVDNHTFAVRSDGSLWAWGENNCGQLGDGTLDARSYPVKIMENVKQVSASGNSAMAIKKDDTLWAWGSNSYSHLVPSDNPPKFGDQIDSEEVKSYIEYILNSDKKDVYPSPVKIMDDVQQVSVQDQYTMIIKKDGSLWGWGANHYGQLGDGTKDDNYQPIKIMDNVEQVITRSFCVMAIKEDGSLWAWGLNTDGRLGDGTEEHKQKPVEILDDVKQVSVSYNFSLAVKKDGSLWGWGSNWRGYLGVGTSGDGYPSPVKIMDEVEQAYATFNHAIIIRKDGSLWASGYNENGQLGDGSFVNRHRPVKILDNVKQVAASENYTMAVKKDGTLWTWGISERGRLGLGQTGNIYRPVKIMDGVKKVSADEYHVMVIKNDGTLWGWGDNYYGQVGIGNTDIIEISKPMLIADGSIIIGAESANYGTSETDSSEENKATSAEPFLHLPVHNSEEQSDNSASNNQVISDFSDVSPSDWYYKDIMEAKRLGFISGVGDNKYEPNETITYGQYIAALVRVFCKDSEIEDIQGSKHWADKYVVAAEEMGMFEAREIEETSKGYGIKDVVSIDRNRRTKVVDLDTGILRQDMMRYACKVLGITPVSETDIFFDCPSETTKDNTYISAAYFEYLTEGMGRDEYGYKVFGFNKTATRAELATILLRVKAYKENPSEYKKVKAENREAAEKAYQIAMLKKMPGYVKGDEEIYRVENGYKIPKNTQVFECGREDFGYGILDISLRTLYDNDEDIKVTKDIIASKFGEEIGNKVLEVIKAKDKEDTEIPITHIRVSKDYRILKIGPVEYRDINEKVDYYLIALSSLSNSSYINVTVFAPDNY